MADTAEAKPLSDDGAADAPSQPTNPSGASNAGEEKGKNVAFGTFFTVGPKEYRDVTILGYNRSKNTVNAIRRSGNSSLQIEIPYEQYKTLLETQRASDLATGRKSKKNSSKIIQGFFGRSIPRLENGAQVIGYDAQSDEVLVKSSKGTSWIKPADVLKATQLFQAPNPDISEAKAATKKSSVLVEKGGRIDEERTAILRKAIQEGRVKIEDVPGQKIRNVSVDINGRILREVETAAETLQPIKIRLETQDRGSATTENLEEIFQELTKNIASAAPDQIKTEIKIEIPQTADEDEGAAAETIRELRKQMGESRPPAASIESVSKILDEVSVEIPSTANNASVIAGAKSIVDALGRAEQKRTEQMSQISGRLKELGDQIDAVQKESRAAISANKISEGFKIRAGLAALEKERQSLLMQQTNAQVQGVFINQRLDEIAASAERLVTEGQEKNLDANLADFQKLIDREKIAAPSLASPEPPSLAQYERSRAAEKAAGSRVPAGASSGPSLASPEPPSLAQYERGRAAEKAVGAGSAPRTFAPSPPIRPVNPGIAKLRARLAKPIKPLGANPVGTDAARAVDFNAAQQADRVAGRNGIGAAGAEQEMPRDAYESAMSQAGALPGYRGPLDLPERKARSYAAGAEDEVEAPDFYGAAEEAGRKRQAEVNIGAGEAGALEAPGEAGALEASSTEQAPSGDQEAQPAGPSGPSQDEMARAAALQSAVAMTIAQAAKQQEQKQEQDKTGALQKAEEAKKQIKNVKQAISNLIDAGDAITGLADIIGLIETFVHLNLRLLLTFFKKDLPFIPRAGYPIECGAIACMDINICINVLQPFIFIFIVLIIAALAASSITWDVEFFGRVLFNL